MPVTSQWKVKPPIDPPRQGIWLGPGRPGDDGALLGSLAESVTGRVPQVWLSTNKEQVVAVVGKRGSGKSFTLGVLIEGLVSGQETSIGKQTAPRAVLVFDPLDIYWTTKYPVAPSDNSEANRHYQLARSAGLPELAYEVAAWVPGATNRRPTDPGWFQTLQLSVPAMGLDEWEQLLNVNLMSEPMGQAFGDALSLVRISGYRARAELIESKASFDLSDLVRAVQSDELQAIYHAETLRALRQRLSAFIGTGLFSASGTTIHQLLAPGRASVILLGRMGQSYREAVVAVLTRMLIDARSEGAFAEKRLALDPELSPEDRVLVTEVAHRSVPRTVVALDEAQSFLAPGSRSSVKDVFIRLVKEGRNIGLSAVLATQQPSALDSRVLSQVETFIAHQLVTEPDIRAVGDNRKSGLPGSIQFGAQQLDEADLMRQLPPGVCLVSAADMNTTVRRSIVVAVRPRTTVHGGIEL